MIKIYGSNMCHDCEELKKNLDFYGLEYEYVNINENLKNLKEFLHIRDNSDLFINAKTNGQIGIPLIKEGDFLTLDAKSFIESKGYYYIDSTCTTKTCTIDGKGC